MAAADDIYLRSNLNASDGNSYYSWNYDINSETEALRGQEYKFTYVETNSSNEDVYRYIINGSDITGDLYFRLWIAGWAEQLKPEENQKELDLSSNIKDGYTINSYWNNYKHTGNAGNYFIVKHSKIKASSYCITLYKKNGTFTPGGSGEIWMEVSIVSMPAPISSSLGYATFSCNRALDLSGVNAYYASALTSDKRVILTKTTAKVPAGTGLLIQGDDDIDIPVVATNVEGIMDLSDYNLLHASVVDTPVAASNSNTNIYHYFLAGSSAADLGFYNLASDATSKAGKAYLETTTELASEGSNGARAAWVFEDGTQGISDATRTALTTDAVYDLQGRVAKAAKAGLYIKNGKKIIVK